MRTGRWGLALALLTASGWPRAQTPAPAATTVAPPKPAQGLAPLPIAQRKAQQAEEAARAGDWRTALFSWREAAYLDPANAGYHIRVGEAYEKLSHADEAVREYELAAALDPASGEARRRAERARAARNGKAPPPEAARTAGAATPAAPAYEAGVALIGKGQYAEALVSLDEAVRKDPGLAVAYSARASALFGLGRYLDSAADYRTALSLDPSRATPLFGLGECNRLLGQGAAAAGFYARYVESAAPDVRDDLRAEARKRLGELRR